MMNSDELRALRDVLDYLHEEEKHFESCEPVEQKGHVWLKMQTLES